MTHLTIPDDEPIATFEPVSASTGPINISWPITDKLDLRVIADGVELTQSDFDFTPTSTVEGGYQAGYVTLDVAASVALVWRDMPTERETDFATGPFDTAGNNTALDRLHAMVQDARILIDRAIRLPLTSDKLAAAVDPPTPSVDNFVMIDADGNVVFSDATDFTGPPGADGTDGIDGTNGTNGTNGSDGNDGWSPVFAVVSDGSRRVLQVADWTGGEGVKPATGKYVGATGLETLIANGVDIRGATGTPGAGTGDMLAANNLSDVSSVSTALTNLGFSAFVKTLIDDANAGAFFTTLGVSAFVQTLLDDANAGAFFTTLGISAFAQTILDDADAAAVRTTIGALASSSYTAADVLSKLLTVDGAGSTLDADTVDGLQASAFALVADYASAAQIIAKTASKIVTSDKLFDAAAPVALTDAATISADFATFINAKVTLGGNRTLGQPSNIKKGQAGCIEITQDGTGSRTLAYHADWYFAGGDPTLSTAAGAVDLLFYQVLDTGKTFASLVKGIA